MVTQVAYSTLSYPGDATKAEREPVLLWPWAAGYGDETPQCIELPLVPEDPCSYFHYLITRRVILTVQHLTIHWRLHTC